MSEIKTPQLDEDAPVGRLDRRGFLKYIGRGAAVALLGNAAFGPKSGNIAYEPEGNWGYKDDMKLAGLGLASEVISVVAMKSIGLSAGNAGMNEMSKKIAKKPVKGAIGMVALGPALEEAAFRWLPSTAADFIHPRGRNSRRWILGTLNSIGFAAIHNYKTEKAEKTMYPVPQFITGMFQWYAQRRGGYKHATFTHAFHNAVIYPLVLVGAHAANKEKSDLVNEEEHVDIKD